MFPTPDQIQLASYHRWQRGGGGHGHDLDDWVAAEQDLLFALNYEVISHYRLDGESKQFFGDRSRRVCRFCEQAAPRATFADSAPAIPESLGNRSLFAFDECEECRIAFEEAFGDEFEEFSRPFRAGLGVDRLPQASPPSWSRAPIAAFKGLAKMALAIMPEAELEFFHDTIEWVINPDHGFDRSLFDGPGFRLLVAPASLQSPWTALARRVETDARFPYMLFFLGLANVVFMIAVPMSLRDEDLDADAPIIPRVASPCGMSGQVTDFPGLARAD